MRSDARKRLHPEPLPHHDPAVRALIEAAFQEGLDQGRCESWSAYTNAIHEDERRANEVDA